MLAFEFSASNVVIKLMAECKGTERDIYQELLALVNDAETSGQHKATETP